MIIFLFSLPVMFSHCYRSTASFLKNLWKQHPKQVKFLFHSLLEKGLLTSDEEFNSELDEIVAEFEEQFHHQSK